jgi:hypothetical protein
MNAATPTVTPLDAPNQEIERNGLFVIIFDDRGLWLSNWTTTYRALEKARDAKDLMDVPDLKEMVISGWSRGRHLVPVFMTLYLKCFPHALPIGRIFAGPKLQPADELYCLIAAIPNYQIEDGTKPFFEPRLNASSHMATAKDIATFVRNTVPHTHTSGDSHENHS